MRVDTIAGLEATVASARVRSDLGLPLLVERSMFWNGDNHSGHTGSSVDEPSTRWFFAEGSQGFFDTFNDIGIIVERSMYWDQGGVPFSGGTNATGIPLSRKPS